ncbi:MAG: carbohydrate-binding protein [Lentimonas sp.]
MLKLVRYILVFLVVITQTAQAEFVHPGITNTRSDLDRIKAMVEAQVDPWHTSYQEMAADSKSSYNYTVRGDPSFTVLGRDDGTNYRAWNDDIRAAYYNAIRWYVTGDERHAEKAVEIFNAWNNLEDVTSGGTRALSGAIVYIMLEAAEIIKSTYDGWPESEIQEFKDMLVYPGYSNTAEPAGISRTSGSFYWQAYQGDSVRHGNQGLAGFRAVMAMGIFLDNEIIYDRALRYIQGLPHRPDDLAYPPGPHTATTVSSTGTYADTYNYTQSTTIEDFGFNELITNYIWITGQCQESSRDQSHSNFGLGILCAMSEMAWNQGYDLYSHAGDRLLLGLEFTAKYNVSYLQSYPDQTTWWNPTVASGEFIEGFNASQRVYTKAISPINVGGFPGSQPIFELPVGHYLGRGLKTAEEVKWTVRARDYAQATTGYENAGHVNGAVGWGALTESRADYCYGDPINGFSNDLPVFEMSVLPGTIEAENYDYSPVDGEGRTYHDTTATNSGGAYRVADGVDISACSEGGYQLTEIEDGEWVSYTVSVEDAGAYQLAVRYAAAEDVTIRFEFAGSDVTGNVTLPSTGGATNWASYLVGNDLSLTKGVQSLRVYFPDTSVSYGLNSMTIWNEATEKSRFEAEAYDAFFGVQTQSTSDVGGGLNLGYIDDGNWCRYDNIPLDGASTFKVRVARNTGRSDGRIEVRLDSLAGTLIGSVDVPETGGWNVWETIETNLTATAGTHSIYLIFTKFGSGSGSSLFDVNWFEIDNDMREVVQTLPYAENFEGGLGAWTQSSDDDFDWSSGSGYTTTTNTGPSAASNSSQYLYLETHDSSDQYKMAQLSCAFDLSTVTSAELVFNYHMYGEDIDYLAVDVYDGTVWTPNVWIRTGEQHASSEQMWALAKVDLSHYVGNSAVTLRFRGKQAQWHLADMAIDNIRIEELPPYDLWAASIFSNAPEGTDQTASGNPDGDPFNNQMEWALATDPLVASGPTMGTVFSNGHFIVTYYRRDPAVTGIDVYASWTNLLTAEIWKLDGDGMTESSLGWSDGVESVSASVPIDGQDTFIRINAGAQ